MQYPRLFLCLRRFEMRNLRREGPPVRLVSANRLAKNSLTSMSSSLSRLFGVCNCFVASFDWLIVRMGLGLGRRRCWIWPRLQFRSREQFQETEVIDRDLCLERPKLGLAEPISHSCTHSLYVCNVMNLCKFTRCSVAFEIWRVVFDRGRCWPFSKFLNDSFERGFNDVLSISVCDCAIILRAVLQP